MIGKRLMIARRGGGRAAAVWLLVGVLAWCAGCASEADERSAGRDELRLVSLAPGLTQMVVDLGLGDRLVGVAEHDAAAPAGLPVVGNYADVNTEHLIALSPTHVLTLTSTREPPRRLRELAAAGLFDLVAYPFPFTIDEIRQTLHRDRPADEAGDSPPLGEALGVPERAKALLARFDDRLARLRELTADREPPRVLMLIGTNPIMASGPGTVHDELLGWIGAVNAAADARVTAPTYSREGLLSLMPDVILIMSPGAPPLREGDARLEMLRGLPLPAVEHERIHLIDHTFALLASTSLPEVATTMAATIHPDLADELAR